MRSEREDAKWEGVEVMKAVKGVGEAKQRQEQR